MLCYASWPVTLSSNPSSPSQPCSSSPVKSRGGEAATDGNEPIQNGQAACVQPVACAPTTPLKLAPPRGASPGTHVPLQPACSLQRERPRGKQRARGRRVGSRRGVGRQQRLQPGGPTSPFLTQPVKSQMLRLPWICREGRQQPGGAVGGTDPQLRSTTLALPTHAWYCQERHTAPARLTPAAHHVLYVALAQAALPPSVVLAENLLELPQGQTGQSMQATT